MQLEEIADWWSIGDQIWALRKLFFLVRIPKLSQHVI